MWHSRPRLCIFIGMPLPNTTRHSRGIVSLLLAPRIWLSVAITLFFAVMVVLLYRREAGTATSVKKLGITPDLLTATWVDYEQPVWIRRAGKTIGANLIEIRRDDPTGAYNLRLRSRLQLDVLNVPMPVQVDLAVLMNDRFEMQDVRGRLLGAGQEIKADAFVENLQLYYRMKGPPQLITDGGLAGKTALERPVLLADAIRPLVTQNRELKVGSRWTTDASDPISGNFSMKVTVEVEAEETIELDGQSVRAFRLTETAGDTVTTSWYDAEGMLLKTDLGNGLEMVRADLKQVYETYPDLKLPPNFGPLDRDTIRLQAIQAGETDASGALPWLPNL